MSGRDYIVIVAAGIAAIVAFRQLPNLLPWPTRLRWLLAAQVVDPIWGFGETVGFDMCEVVLTAVEAPACGIRLHVSESRRPSADRTVVLVSEQPTRAALATLDKWRALQTPLLLVTRGPEEATLHGPTISIVGVRESSPSRARSPRSDRDGHDSTHPVSNGSPQ